MALRIRKGGRVVCAAQYEAKEGDTYIDDGVHYILARYFEQDHHDEEWSTAYRADLEGDTEAINRWRSKHPEQD